MTRLQVLWYCCLQHVCLCWLAYYCQMFACSHICLGTYMLFTLYNSLRCPFCRLAPQLCTNGTAVASIFTSPFTRGTETPTSNTWRSPTSPTWFCPAALRGQSCTSGTVARKSLTAGLTYRIWRMFSLSNTFGSKVRSVALVRETQPS